MNALTIMNSNANVIYANEKHFSKYFLFWYKLSILKLFILDVDYAMNDADGKSF